MTSEMGKHFSCGTDNSSTWTFKVSCLVFLAGNGIHLPAVQDLLSIDSVLSSHFSQLNCCIFPTLQREIVSCSADMDLSAPLCSNAFCIPNSHYWKRNEKLSYLSEQGRVTDLCCSCPGNREGKWGRVSWTSLVVIVKVANASMHYWPNSEFIPGSLDANDVHLLLASESQ